MIKLPTTSVGTLRKFLVEHRDVMFKYIVKEIERGLDKDAAIVNLFRFGETRYVAALKRTEYIVALQDALGFFIKHELYEDASKCKNIITIIQSKEDQNNIETFLQDL